MAVRNRGTHGGSCALADPSAEIPACAAALEASFVLRGPGGERCVPSEEFFRGLYETALMPAELLLRIDYPRARPGWRYAFEEVARRRGDFAIAGLAAAASVEGGRIRKTRLAFLGVADRPVLVCAASRDEARAAIEATQVIGNDLYPAAYRRRLMRVLLERVWSTLENE
jgi:carbon-monoxide dehydrogenase medium subunit